MKIRPTVAQIKKVLLLLEKNKIKLKLGTDKLRKKYKPLTLREVGEMLGVSHEQIRIYQKKYGK